MFITEVVQFKSFTYTFTINKILIETEALSLAKVTHQNAILFKEHFWSTVTNRTVTLDSEKIPLCNFYILYKN